MHGPSSDPGSWQIGCKMMNGSGAIEIGVDIWLRICDLREVI